MPKKYKYRKTFTFNGKRYQIYADTLEEVIAKRERKRIELEKEVVITENMTLSTWSKKCIDAYKTNLSDEGLKDYKRMVKKHILNYLGNLKLSEIRSINLQEILNLQKGMSKTQINYVYQQLTFLFSRAYMNNLIKTDISKNLQKPKAKAQRKRRSLTKDERTAVLEVAKTDRRYYLFLIILLCGLRPSEAGKVKREDITLINGQPILKVKGTKTANASRLVPVPDELYLIVKKIPQNEYIAVTQKGNPYKEKYMRTKLWQSFKRQVDIYLGAKVCRNAIVESVIADDFVMYNLRHEYCTDLARKGVDIRIAQKLMGHANISMTANIYTTFTENDIVEIANLLK